MNPRFHPWKVAVPLLKIVSFLCFHMSQAPSMKVSMKKGLLNWRLGFLHHLVEREAEVPDYAQMIPALLAEGAGEE
jgi:hypothetical protein